MFETVDTRFTQLLGCRLPFQLAVLGGVGTTELAAVVCAQGGLGMVPFGRAAEAAGCDLVVAQGVEAGGHVRGKAPLDELLTAMLAAVEVPVVATGGIGTAQRVAALIAAGADAVRVGTRFLACPECNTHPAYVEALIAARAEDTVLTDAFDDDGRWPASVRVIGDSLVQARQAGNRSAMPPTREAEHPLRMACYAGMSVRHLTRIQPAAEVLVDLASEL